MPNPAYENEFNTFEGWKKLGRRIKAGEKSYKRNRNGTAVFHKDQTQKVKIYVPRSKALPRSEFVRKYGW